MLHNTSLLLSQLLLLLLLLLQALLLNPFLLVGLVLILIHWNWMHSRISSRPSSLFPKFSFNSLLNSSFKRIARNHWLMVLLWL